MSEPTWREVQDAVNAEIKNGNGEKAHAALIAAGWIPTNRGWLRCRPEMPGDREFVLSQIRKAQ